MKPIYVFYDESSTRIPLSFSEMGLKGYVTDVDRNLHNIFTVKGKGVFNEESREYVFNRKVDASKLSTLIPDRPILCFNMNTYKPQDIIGFFNRPWEDDYIVKQDNTKPAVMPKEKETEVIYFTDEWQTKLLTELHSRKYAVSTVDSYLYYNKLMCQWNKKEPDKLKVDDVKKFLAYMEQEGNQSAASLNIALSAFKFLFNYVLKTDRLREQKRPRQDKRLPVVLSKSEIKKMIFNVKNPKHQLLLMIVYSSGLRVGEVVKLKKENIDISRKAVFINKGKGRKDRYTITSDMVIKALKEYLEKYNITDWLFPGQPATRHIHVRTAQNVFEQALERSGIEKTATTHSLRHSFATHLLESGVDIVYIRDLLGHASIRTTERYTHVAKRKALRITSPLDTIDEPDDYDTPESDL